MPDVMKLPEFIPEPEEAPKPHVGAPYGNQNGLKHGFYSKHFTIGDLDINDPVALQDEIDLLRVYMRHVVVHAGEANKLEDAVAILRVLSAATYSIARLTRIQKLNESQEDDFMEEFNAALKDAQKDLGIM